MTEVGKRRRGLWDTWWFGSVASVWQVYAWLKPPWQLLIIIVCHPHQGYQSHTPTHLWSICSASN